MPATTATTTAVTIRWAHTRDLPALAACAADPAWDADAIRRRLKPRGAVGYVAEWRGMAVGFAVVELLPSRVRLVYLAVHPEARGAGVGRLLAATVKERAGENGRRGAVAVVRETDATALGFLRATGFAAVKVLRADDGPDGIVMEWVPN